MSAYAGAGAGGGHGRAVVIGAGLAGLTAARALANFMDHVTVIERDRVPSGPGRRPGVPQARHTHTLVPAAHQGLERLFPGIGQDLAGAGAVPLTVPRDVLLLGPGGWLPRSDTGVALLSAGRDLIDAVVRTRLRTDPKVAFLPGHEAVALRGGRHDTVTGVWTHARDRGAPHGRGGRRLLPAEFVVDASGRGSHARRWLAELGYQQAPQSLTSAPSACASAVFAPPVGHVADWRSLVLSAAPGHPRQGVLHPVEGGRWSVTLTTAGPARPPAGHSALLHAARALRHPLLHDVLAAATPLGPVYGRTRTGACWHRYEKLRRWPDQFLVVGDALAELDAPGGQGMALAVQCALALDQLLACHGTAVGISHRLRHAMAGQVAPAWQQARSASRTAHGPRARYAARIAAAATTDPYAAGMLLRTLHGITPPPGGALRPRALRAALRTPRGPAPYAPPSTTHGPDAPRRRAPAAPARPAGAPHPRPTGLPAPAPAGERGRP
ncbi:FAD-dependent oxidoreductase [Streptomyces sp. NBC_00989]|uniref:FAD-dependent oxidoreductase n=1 Tax=Streptomyces sp. NBC_00989 TaxID=2903705 RepID=UPI0038677534|nr:NAD-binding protein [Streptomyces sp. NBC_00989]WSW98024.1 NAD-binding protein [Streptomyces sp. NBC_00989]